MDIDLLLAEKYEEIDIPNELLKRNYYKEIKHRLFVEKLILTVTIISVIFTTSLVLGQLQLNRLVNENILSYAENLK